MKVSESLKRFRDKFGLTQNDVASAVGIMQQAYYRYESERNVPSVEVIIKIAKAYDVSADYLLGLIDLPRPIKTADFDNELIEAVIKYKEASNSLNEIFIRRGLKGGETQ